MRKKRHIRWLALTVVVLMALMQLFPLTFADNEEFSEITLMDDGEAADDKPILSVDYLGISTEYSGPKPKQPVPIMENGNVTFWVGVSVDKLDQVPFIRKHGLYGLEIGFDYNPTYVEPWNDLAAYADLRPTSSDEAKKTEAWLATLEKYNFEEDANQLNADVWDANLYELKANDSVRAAGVDTDPWREENVSESWKMGFVSIRKKADVEKSEETNRFYGVTDTSEKYILKMPFRLKAVPPDGSKPLVFKLSRGPSTLSMSAGANGYEDFAAWEREDRSEPEHNLKNIFTFGGDLNIFGGSNTAGAMSDLTVSRTVEGAEEILDLHTDATLDTVTSYTAERMEYYVQVPAETSEVTLTMLGLSEAPTVTHSDNDATTTTLEVSAGAGGYTADVTLVDVDMTKNGGFNNTVTIKVGETSYFVYIRKLVQPRIVLEYGNSPYGEIMKSDLEDKDAAKAQFNLNNRFTAGYTPENVAPKAKTASFGYRSWVDVLQSSTPTEEQQALIADPNVNMDRNEYAIFIYDNTESFVDPGFTVTNSFGESVPVTRTVEVNSMAVNNVTTFASGVITEVSITIPAGTEEITQITNLESGYVVPGIYTMTYSAEDIDGSQIVETNAEGESSPIQRKVVVLHRLGDTDFSGGIGSQDFNQLYQAISNFNSYLSNVDLTARRLFIYRTLDTDFSDGIGSQDFNAIYNGINSQGRYIENLYRELPLNIDTG